MGLLLIVGMFLLVFLGMPVAFSLGASSSIVLIWQDKVPLDVIVQRMFSGVDSFPLMAIPFFILAGSLMETGGISERLTKFATAMVGKATGGLGLVTVATCLFFGAVSGSAAAMTAAVGALMIPSMVQRGYHKNFSAATVASAASLGVIIPPSIPMVLYGVASGQSIGTLFIAGIIPGLFIGGALMLVCYFISKKEGYKGTEQATRKEKFIAFKDAIGALLMPVIILGGIYSGFFTPTEAAAVAVLYGFVVSMFIYKEIKLRDLKDILFSSALTTSIIMIILANASLFGWIMARERVPQLVAEAFTSFSSSPIVYLLLVNILLLFVGCIFESSAAIIILTPILYPIAIQMGIDPIHFGIVMVVNLAIGYVTPPLGINLFIACKISELRIEDLVVRLLPFLITLVATLLVLTYIPQITLFLPKLLGM